MLTILKKIGLIGVIIGGLIILGNTINSIVPWIWLKNFFIILRNTAELFDFILDINTLWTIMGIALTIQISIWIFEATIWAVKYFKR